MIKPLLLLDVDGVVCPLGNRAREPMVEATGRDFYVRFAEDTPRRLAALGEAFQLVWATSWEAEANDVLSPLLALPPLPYVRFDPHRARPGETWKLRDVRRYVRDRPAAWVDDELGYDALRWARERKEPTLLLEARADCGLTMGDVEELLKFARRVAA